MAETGRWSAFVARTWRPCCRRAWLDVPPNPDGQADLLSRIAITQTAAFQQALDQLTPAVVQAPPDATGNTLDPRDTDRAAAGQGLDPRQFLLAVMNDPGVELRLRIEAAKALLPGSEDRRGG